MRMLTAPQWKNPRATAITYAGTVLFIFVSRYLNILRYLLRGSYIALFSV